MKYLIGVACLAISVPSVAPAQWSHFGTVLKDNDIYLDHERFERLEQPTLWVLFDSKTPDEDGSRSVTQHYQADCNSNQVRTLEFEYFEGHMGKGRLIRRSSKASNWETPDSMSILENLLDFMCDRYINRKKATGLVANYVIS
jgi:hypothetical protein